MFVTNIVKCYFIILNGGSSFIFFIHSGILNFNLTKHKKQVKRNQQQQRNTEFYCQGPLRHFSVSSLAHGISPPKMNIFIT